MSDIVQYTPWSIDISNINDFTVPAGAFSISNVSPIEALAQMAQQVGCMLKCDDEKQIIAILPRYPVSPWATPGATPDVTIHEAVILSHSENEQLNKLCNSCWARGEQQGISAQIRRAGTAGDIATADINEPLIVDNQAARLAGTNAIANTGKKRIHNIVLPVQPDLPPLTAGMLIGVSNTDVFKGTIDSWSVSAQTVQAGGNVAIDIEQNINVIQHLE